MSGVMVQGLGFGLDMWCTVIQGEGEPFGCSFPSGLLGFNFSQHGPTTRPSCRKDCREGGNLGSYGRASEPGSYQQVMRLTSNGYKFASILPCCPASSPASFLSSSSFVSLLLIAAGCGTTWWSTALSSNVNMHGTIKCGA